MSYNGGKRSYRSLSPYYAPEDIADEQIDEWLRMAMSREFNIYKDSNKIIALLCHEIKKNREQKSK
jgi:hypothetical protein